MFVRSMIAMLVTLGTGLTLIGQDGTISEVSLAVSGTDNTAADSQAVTGTDSEVAAATAVSDVVQPRQRPEIPYYAMSQLLQSLRQMELNPTQKTAVEEFYSVGSDRRQVIGDIRLAILTSSYRRFDQALSSEERRLEEHAASTLLATLTDEQKSQLRRKHRGAISEAIQQAQTSEESTTRSLTWMSASTSMMNNDLLTTVEIPSVQDTLQLTDEQFAAIEQAAFEADRIAEQMAKECIDTLLKQKAPAATASARLSPAIQKLQQATDGILTERQKQLYQEHMKGRKEAAQNLLAKEPQKAQQLLFQIHPHGMPSESYTS